MIIADIEKTIREYLDGLFHMSIATSLNNKPWITEVHFSFDKDLNLYFMSKESRRHSEEIAANRNIAGNVVEQHTADQKPRGVYFEGTADLLENVDDNHQAYISYCERFNMGSEILEDANTSEGHKFYEISVDTFYLFDGRESEPSQKYELPWKKRE